VLSWQDLFTALALVLVIEGMMPFVNPAWWRQKLLSIAAIPDSSLRTIGLVSMLAGLGFLYIVR